MFFKDFELYLGVREVAIEIQAGLADGDAFVCTGERANTEQGIFVEALRNMGVKACCAAEDLWASLT